MSPSIAAHTRINYRSEVPLSKGVEPLTCTFQVSNANLYSCKLYHIVELDVP